MIPIGYEYANDCDLGGTFNGKKTVKWVLKYKKFN